MDRERDETCRASIVGAFYADVAPELSDNSPCDGESEA